MPYFEKVVLHQILEDTEITDALVDPLWTREIRKLEKYEEADLKEKESILLTVPDKQRLYYEDQSYRVLYKNNLLKVNNFDKESLRVVTAQLMTEISCLKLEMERKLEDNINSLEQYFERELSAPIENFKNSSNDFMKNFKENISEIMKEPSERIDYIMEQSKELITRDIIDSDSDSLIDLYDQINDPKSNAFI